MKLTEFDFDIKCIIRASSKESLTEEQKNKIKLQTEILINSLYEVTVKDELIIAGLRVHLITSEIKET